MAKVTSKLQLTVPKRVADTYQIRPGDEVELVPSGGFIRMIPASRPQQDLTAAEKVKRFRGLIEEFQKPRKPERDANRAKARAEAARGWKREDLYTRGSPR